MDIQVASNFERLLFGLYNGKGDLVKKAMHKLSQEGAFKLTVQALNILKEDFFSGTASEGMTRETIKKTLVEFGELICPHTSVGLTVANELRETNNSETMVTLGTAHPAKFPDSVKASTGITPILPDRYKDLYLRKEVFLSSKNNFSGIKEIISERTSV